MNLDASSQHGQECIVEPRVSHEPGDVEQTCSSDVDLSQNDHWVDGDLVILVEMMLGHACLDGEQQVHHLGNSDLWQSSMLRNTPL